MELSNASPKTLLTLLEEVCDEAARNGFKKILIINGHGGNNILLRVFMRDSLTKKKDYVLYAMIEPWAPINELAAKLSEGRTFGHACEIETSIGLHLFGARCCPFFFASMLYSGGQWNLQQMYDWYCTVDN
jgi:creatinine amidohydrolase/Fe(II)-dependent formamide hydrolase-like protein